jgi:ornithine--oxo-acid transaminase
VDQFDVTEVLRQRGGERYALQQKYLNPQLSRMLHTIGFDQFYTRASGAYLYDANGREYLDMLAGFGVFALGRHHPVVRQAIHDVINADLADLTQFDAPPLAGVLAERLLATTPHLGLLRQQRHGGRRGGAEIRPLRDGPSAHCLL